MCANFFDRGHFVFYIPLATKHRCTGRSLASPLTKQAPDLQTRMTSMRQRVTPVLSRLCCTFAISAVVVAQAAAQQAQGPTFVRPNLPIAAPAAGMPNAEANTAISRVLDSGHTLEMGGHWADALTKYEEALHEYPEDHSLQGRFDVARLHYSLEQRYDDRSFREALKTFNTQQTIELYTDLMGKIDAHYYTDPPYQAMTQRGAAAMDIALADETFLRNQGIRVRGQQIEQLRTEILQLPGRYKIASPRDAVAVASQIAKLANQRIGLSETATLLEFTSASAGGLDHYSSFLTADQLRDIYSQIEGNFVGLGVELKADQGDLQIVHVIPHSPAEQSGIHDGDRITAVDGTATKSLSTDEAASMLTGAEGSMVRVQVNSPNQAPREVTVRRASVEVPSLENVKILDPATGVAYVKIPAFQKTTATDLEQALWDLHGKGMRSLIIDLRGNPGGLLTAAVEIADKFIADGGIVSTKGRSEQENFNYRAHRPGTWRVPLVVLVDGDSASASEIFAGAIKDSGRGKIVGSRSYGKGSVQGIFPLGKSGAGARLTTAKFYSPSGKAIANVGVTPDIDVRRTGDTHLVGYRGPSNVNGAANGTAANATQDKALEIAVGVVRELPVAQL
jgi:carboxyl-terminal processing protease